MRCRVGAIVLIGVSFAMVGMSKAQVRSTTSIPRSSALSSQDDILSPEMAASRKAALETPLDALERSNLSQEERDKARAPIDEMLTLLNALEDVRERRDTFRQHLDTLPKRLKELAASQKALEARQTGQFGKVTEALRDQYDAERHAIQAEIQSLLRQNSAAEARLAAIPHELEQQLTERLALQQRFAEAKRRFPQLDQPPTPVSEISRLEAQLQLSITEVQALETERQWLIQRGPLHDMLLRVAQTKLTYLEKELAAISGALSEIFEQEQALLSEKILEIEQELDTTNDPLEALRLKVTLETARLRQVTADYRQKLSRLNNHIMAQEQRTVQERQDADRIGSLFEKYANGESGGELLLLAFERLRLERQQFRDASVKGLQAASRAFTQLLYKAEDQLYHYDRQAQMRWSNLWPASQTLPATLRQAFDEKKGALREQQQVLATIAQAYTTLLSLHREYRQLFDNSYYLALTKIFWLRDAERFSLTDVRHVMTGASSAASRFQEMVRAEAAWLRSMLAGALPLWVLAFMLLIVMPWIAYKMHTYLRDLVTSLLTRCAERGIPCGIAHALLIVVRATVWPAYLFLLAWCRTQFVPQEGMATDGLVSSSLQGSAIIFFGALLSRDMLRAEGWGRQFWEWPPELCRFLYRIILVACLAALVLLVPRHVLLTAPGEAEIATASLALARFLLLVFQGILLVLVAIVGWRQNPLMEERLSRSHQAEGLLWRLWPFIYLLLLAGLAGIITLDVLGYRYASRFVWLRSLESFSVLLLWRLLMALLLVRLLHHFVDLMVRLWFRGHRGTTPSTTPFEQVFRVVYIAGNTLLAIIAGGIILEIWGVSVSWFLTSPLGSEILRRAAVIALTIALMVLVMKISRAVTEYLVQPRTTPQGIINQPNRKFRTMVPLIHTLLKFGAVFSAIIVVLQQLNVAIGPILTGVGILGLAVGFASQSLIKDVINGLFILFEDSLSVGDIVTLRGISGEVEKVTLRAVTIRDLNGNVHVIPNSTLDLITNMTKVFSRQVIDVSIAYREDVDSVIEILNELSEELQNDPTYGWDMMRPLEIMGVHDFTDSAVIIRTRLWTLPGKQWRLSREFRRRLKKVFDEREVEIPFPHRTIYWGVPKESPQPPMHIALDPPPSSTQADNGVSRSTELKPPIRED